MNATPIPQSFQDRSLLTGEPCDPPCWYGLVPGITGQSEIIEKLSQLDFIDSESIEFGVTGFFDVITNEPRNGIGVSVNCKYPEGFECVQLTLVDDNLKCINVNLNYDVSFKTISDRLGQPDYFRVNLTGEVLQCIVELVWIDKQLIIGYVEYDSRIAQDLCERIHASKRIDSETPVQFVNYSYEGWINSISTSETAYPWVGFVE